MRYRISLFITISLFVIGLAAGLALSTALPSGGTGGGAADEFFSQMIGSLRELLAGFGPFQANTAAFIFGNNVATLLFSFIFSPILCLPPVVVLLVNSSLISVVSVMVQRQESLGFLLAGLLPHGIFEIPALIIGEAAALSFGAMAIMALISPKRRPLLLPSLKQNLKYLLLAVILMIPAAIIETFVTPLLLR